ncbi:MAG TPA: hypothetical protein VM487_02100 [Phycisphaerae bacterium]|nr:hypothetical protein [Phycisphaerae bacterium]
MMASAVAHGQSGQPAGNRPHAGDEPPGAASQPATRAVDDAAVEEMIRRLGDPSYDARTRATRELCRIGHRAAGALKEAAAGDDFETALRAANLLEVIESVYFGGCAVRLEADPARVSWNEPFELIVTIRNESDYSAQIPLEMSARRRGEVSADARQVGDMVDVADYLRVVSPDGRQVDLKVDDILVDPEVADAVEWRARGGPLGELPPGREVVVRLTDFNRGWARYPLLSRGVHKIDFVYEPQWDDEEFRRAGVGRVASNALEVEVTEAGPAIVRQRVRPAVVTIERSGDELVARLTNSDDLPIWINMNWGTSQAPFAHVVWTVFAGRTHEEELVEPEGRAPPMDAFTRDRLVEVAPGASVEVGRISLAQLLKKAMVQAVPAGRSFQVRAALVNQCDLSWQRRQEPALIGNHRVPEGLRTPLPRRMITGRFPSQPFEVIKPEDAPGR